MKFIHTADWHLGQRLLTKGRQEEHKAFFDWLVQQICHYEVEVLLVCGDVFDVANPPNNALRQYYDFLLQISNTCCRHVIIIGGNHDAVSTLNAPQKLLKNMNIHVIGGATGTILDEVITITTNDHVDAVVAAVPFLRDKDIRMSKPGESYQERVDSIRTGIVSHYEELANITQKYRDVPVIAMGHLFTSGSEPSSSERDIHIGNLAKVNALDILLSFDYVALGHLHRYQEIAQSVRYSGAPIPMNFSECEDPKKIVLIEANGKSIDIQDINVPTFRRLVKFEGSLDEICSEILRHDTQNDWAEIIVQCDMVNVSMRNRLQSVIEKLKYIEVLKYHFEYKHTPISKNEYNQLLTDLKYDEVFEKILPDKFPDKQKLSLRQSFKELLDWMYGKKE